MPVDVKGDGRRCHRQSRPRDCAPIDPHALIRCPWTDNKGHSVPDSFNRGGFLSGSLKKASSGCIGLLRISNQMIFEIGWNRVPVRGASSPPARSTFSTNGRSGSYPGNGIAIAIRIDTIVSVTARHSETAPDRERRGDGVGQSGGSNRCTAAEANRAGRPDHGQIPSRRRRITGNIEESRSVRWQHCGDICAENPETPQALTPAPRLLTFETVLARM